MSGSTPQPAAASAPQASPPPPPNVEGTMRPATVDSVAGAHNDQLMTLDEPVSATFVRALSGLRKTPLGTTSPRHAQMRDLRMVGTKLWHVLLPKGGSQDTLKALRDWDLCAWPVALCGSALPAHWSALPLLDTGGPLLLCLALSISISASASVDQTSLVFAAVFVLVWSGAAVVSLNAQLLGGSISFFQSVCVLGYCVFPLVLASLVSIFVANALVRTIAVVAAYVWSTRASVVFMGSLVPEDRRVLAVYPVCLFYLVVAWMVYVQ